MGHPLVDEFCRAHTLKQEFFRRCQRVFRDEVQTQLDESDRLREENAHLKAELARLTEKADKRREQVTT
jgi:hypothetical protein